MILEKDIEARLTRGVEALGGECLKHGQDGWPDRIVMLPGGRLIWVELKRPRGVQSGVQIYRAVQLAKLGQQVRCLWSAEDVDEFLAGLSE